MTHEELQELGKGDELTAEAIEMLIHDQSFFERAFQDNCVPFRMPREVGQEKER